jgi:cytochrome c-type biogenesis protein CcmH/NrfG
MKLKTYHYYLLDSFVLLLVVAAVYGRVLGYDFMINGDDNLYVVNNPTIRGFSWGHVKAAFGPSNIGQYNPLALLSFMVDFKFWGFDPTGYHLTNIVIHAANGLLVYHLLMRLYSDRLLSLVASALFLFHPVQVESVAWVSERKGLLSAFFMLLSWESYVSYCEPNDKKKILFYLVSLFTFLLSLLAKPMTVIFPMMLIVFDFSFSISERRVRILEKIPYFVAAAVFSGIVMYCEMPQHGGTRVDYHGGSGWATFLTMLPVFCRYFGMLVWPANLSVDYVATIHNTVDVTVILAALLLAAIVIAGIKLFKTDRRMAFWLILFWLALLPVSQIVPLATMMFDHYLYLPVLGVGVLTGSLAVYIRDRSEKKRVRILYSAVFLWLIILGVSSFQRARVWQNYWTLLADFVEKSPGSVNTWIIYGEVYQRAGNLPEAVKGYEYGLKIDPFSTESMWRLGNLYTENGELEKGKEFLTKLLAINSKHIKGLATLGDNYLKHGNFSEADKAYRRALSLQPEAEPVIISLGKLAVLQKNFEQGRNLYNQIEAKGFSDPDNAYRMACLEALSGRPDESLAWFEKALLRGFRDYDTIRTNKEMSELWNNPRFMFLLTQYFPDMEQ